MKTILIPTDFSKNVDNALRFAIALARKENAKLILLHVNSYMMFTPEVPMEFLMAQRDVLIKASESQLHSLAKKTEKTGLVKCETISTEGLLVDMILETEKERKIDWIVMGTKGAKGLKQFILGSNTASVIERANCPVIAVPENVAFNGLKNIVYATDYRDCDIDNLVQLLEIAKPFHSEITLLHISDDTYPHSSERTVMEEFKEHISREIAYSKLHFKLIFGHDFHQRLEDYLRASGTDLLVMATQHRSLIDKLFHNSSTKEMSFHSRIPLMAYHFKSEPVHVI